MSQEQARRFREVVRLLKQADWQRDSHASATASRNSPDADETERKAGRIINEMVLEAFKSQDPVSLLAELENSVVFGGVDRSRDEEADHG